ncbi:uncharacterized protein LOC114273247 [Camellia sinensis]|uniref:uncharacterized protein LOC114273247 n=1 Tax=Camellia sinensis TaxID=4442 RepID=UPI00103607FC|nr:uncharacterized protein LOC114273247 [Camellia sinensis]
MRKVALVRKRLISTQRFYEIGKSRKLSLIFIGLFEILKRIGEYELDRSHMLDWTDSELDENASYEEKPVWVLDTRNQVLRGKTIPLVKVSWRQYGVEKATWEREFEVREKYSDLFVDI